MNPSPFFPKYHGIDPVLKISLEVGSLCNVALGISPLKNMFELVFIRFFLTFKFLMEAELCQTDSSGAKLEAFPWASF